MLPVFPFSVLLSWQVRTDKPCYVRVTNNTTCLGRGPAGSQTSFPLCGPTSEPTRPRRGPWPWPSQAPIHGQGAGNWAHGDCLVISKWPCHVTGMKIQLGSYPDFPVKSSIFSTQTCLIRPWQAFHTSSFLWFWYTVWFMRLTFFFLKCVVIYIELKSTRSSLIICTSWILCML